MGGRKNSSRNVRLAIFTRPPKRPTQAVDQARQSNDLHLGRDYTGIRNEEMSREVADEEVLWMGKRTLEM